MLAVNIIDFSLATAAGVLIRVRRSERILQCELKLAHRGPLS
jgi:hypothetical protein